MLRQVKQKDIETKMQNQTIVDLEAQQAMEQLQIKITGPVPAKEQNCLQPMQRQFCVKTLNKLGVKRFRVSARHLVQQKLVQRVQADSRVDCGSADRINILKRNHDLNTPLVKKQETRLLTAQTSYKTQPFNSCPQPSTPKPSRIRQKQQSERLHDCHLSGRIGTHFSFASSPQSIQD